jgi:hypothetical protein
MSDAPDRDRHGDAGSSGDRAHLGDRDDAMAWETWLRSSRVEVVLADDVRGLDEREGLDDLLGPAGLDGGQGWSDAGLDDPWGGLDIALEPLTDAQRAHLRSVVDAAPRSQRVPEAFRAIDEIDEIDEI